MLRNGITSRRVMAPAFSGMLAILLFHRNHFDQALVLLKTCNHHILQVHQQIMPLAMLWCCAEPHTGASQLAGLLGRSILRMPSVPHKISR